MENLLREEVDYSITENSISEEYNKENIYDINAFKVPFINVNKIKYKNNKDNVNFDVEDNDHNPAIDPINLQFGHRFLMDLIKAEETISDESSDDESDEELKHPNDIRVVEIFDDKSDDDGVLIGDVALDPNNNNLIEDDQTTEDLNCN